MFHFSTRPGGRTLIERAVLASNYDDHLRNHGFLMCQPGRWSLSPAFDLNPVPEIDRVCLSKTPTGEGGSIAGALAIAGRFGIKGPTAKSILREVFTAVAGWRETAKRLLLKRATVQAYASAFEHALMDEARRLLAV